MEWQAADLQEQSSMISRSQVCERVFANVKWWWYARVYSYVSLCVCMCVCRDNSSLTVMLLFALLSLSMTHTDVDSCQSLDTNFSYHSTFLLPSCYLYQSPFHLLPYNFLGPSISLSSTFSVEFFTQNPLHSLNLLKMIYCSVSPFINVVRFA